MFEVNHLWINIFHFTQCVKIKR